MVSNFGKTLDNIIANNIQESISEVIKEWI